MKIAFMNYTEKGPAPEFSQCRKMFEKYFEKVARPDTEIVMRFNRMATYYGMAVYYEYPGGYDHLMNVENAINAEKEGFDAAVESCYVDPGIRAARAICNIPVVGGCESSMALATLLGSKFTEILVDLKKMLNISKSTVAYKPVPKEVLELAKGVFDIKI